MRHVTVLFTLAEDFLFRYLFTPVVSSAFLSNSVPWMPAMKNQDYALTPEHASA